ncbi:transposase [Rhodococcus sp. Rp3]|nr:transposase [Rhodococcus sp. Rp3]
MAHRYPRLAGHVFSDHTRGSGWTLPILEVRHRQRARAEDRLRALKSIGMRNRPFHGFAQNQIWLEVVCLAAHLFAWLQILGWGREGAAVRRQEPKRLRLRILAVAGRIINIGRRLLLRLPRGWRHNHLIDTATAAASTVR